MLSLYVGGATLIHRMDPMTKMIYVLAAASIPFIIPRLAVAFACLLISLIMLIIGRVLLKTLPLLGFSLIVLHSMIIIQGLYMPENRTAVFTLGPLIFYKEGLLFAALLCVRIVGLISAISVLVLTTAPTLLIQALVEKGFSPKLGYVMQSVLQIIPQMVQSLHKITDAQRSRGMETEGKLWTRAKAFLPLLGPAVMNALIQTKDRAMALEVRAFNSPNKRTFLIEYHPHPIAIWLRLLLLGCIVLAIVWRLFL
ncbi:energy-coupling factor transporter transmembrane component T family protein [Camelliibacillus cellulosilyticus]|uniref:Energy-coupling factor transporter transmembrane component T family protein n=1 Tax=Camelliibacillus cellulosilyticus TaxID=2174486 RepID=A0ABV9GR89_9BACL